MTQMHFEFDEWEEAFQTYYENEIMYGDSIVLIVSTHPYSEGYWLESKPDPLQLRPTDKVYQGAQVKPLETLTRQQAQRIAMV